MDFYDLFQNRRISKVDERAGHAENEADGNRLDISTLRERVDYLSLVVLAFSELLEEQGVSRQRILNKIREVDLRDGRLDNKYSPDRTRHCPDCGRVASEKRVRCLYCGAALDRETVL